jgi:hypothetical protein
MVSKLDLNYLHNREIDSLSLFDQGHWALWLSMDFQGSFRSSSQDSRTLFYRHLFRLRIRNFADLITLSTIDNGGWIHLRLVSLAFYQLCSQGCHRLERRSNHYNSMIKVFSHTLILTECWVLNSGGITWSQAILLRYTICSSYQWPTSRNMWRGRRSHHSCSDWIRPATYLRRNGLRRIEDLHSIYDVLNILRLQTRINPLIPGMSMNRGFYTWAQAFLHTKHYGTLNASRCNDLWMVIQTQW